ncbi:MAG TPA: hypothetical protein VGH63_17940, partial [Polyangia bacterium]
MDVSWRAAVGVGLVVVAVAGCGEDGAPAAGADLASLAGGLDGGAGDVGVAPDDGGGAGACEWGGAPGTCLTL